ncbi:hypothetical protein TELCIR_04807 [Teladorsagia circumcincta]|uniref:Uncharacterized protein n=1 Tax=Teladorsagia circumcincta TaxID=45464 RepID=A0A2G9USI5_TELCI|nr:hypothetical protein TELCIR_04807 [Teladorsagia circumcincta]
MSLTSWKLLTFSSTIVHQTLKARRQFLVRKRTPTLPLVYGRHYSAMIESYRFKNSIKNTMDQFGKQPREESRSGRQYIQRKGTKQIQAKRKNLARSRSDRLRLICANFTEIQCCTISYTIR